MVTIPTERAVNRVIPNAGTVTSAAPTVSSAEGLQTLAQGLGNAGTVVVAEQFRQLELEATSQAKDRDARAADEIRTIMYDPEGGFANLNGENAVTARASTIERLDGLLQRSAEGLSPAAQRKLDGALRGRIDRAKGVVDRHTATERETWATTSSAARIVSAQQDMVADMAMTGPSLAAIEGEIREQGARQGWSAEVIGLKVSEAKSTALRSQLDRLAVYNPAGALDYLLKNKDQMLPTVVADLERTYVPLLNERIGREIGGAVAAGSGVSAAGASASYFHAIRQSESGGNDSAKNPNSTATGRYQFIESTWEGLMKSHPELGLTSAGRTDPDQQEAAIRAFTQDNSNVLKRNGVPPTNGNLYAAHFLGAGTAAKVLRGDSGALVSTLVSQKVIDANPFLKNMTVGGFSAWASRKGGGDAQQYTMSDIMDLDNPTQRDAALAEYKLQTSVQSAQATAEKDTLTAQAIESLNAGGSVSTLTPGQRDVIGVDGVTKLMKYESTLAGGVKPQTDYGFYATLTDQFVTNPEAIRNADVTEWRNKLDDGDFEYFVKQRATLMAGGGAVKDVALTKVTGSVREVMTDIGLAPKDNLELKGHMVSSLLAWAEENPADASNPLKLYQQTQRMLANVEIDYTFGNFKSRAVDIDMGGRTVSKDDDLDPSEFKTQFLQGDVYINGNGFSSDEAQSFIDQVTAALGHEPSGQEILQLLIAKVQ